MTVEGRLGIDYRKSDTQNVMKRKRAKEKRNGEAILVYRLVFVVMSSSVLAFICPNNYDYRDILMMEVIKRDYNDVVITFPFESN